MLVWIGLGCIVLGIGFATVDVFPDIRLARLRRAQRDWEEAMFAYYVSRHEPSKPVTLQHFTWEINGNRNAYKDFSFSWPLATDADDERLLKLANHPALRAETDSALLKFLGEPQAAFARQLKLRRDDKWLVEDMDNLAVTAMYRPRRLREIMAAFERANANRPRWAYGLSAILIGAGTVMQTVAGIWQI